MPLESTAVMGFRKGRSGPRTLTRRVAGKAFDGLEEVVSPVRKRATLPLLLCCSLLFLPLLLSACGHENESSGEESVTCGSGCFTRHLTDAIPINQERMRLYARLTQGRSRRVSVLLIAAEKMGVPMAEKLDELAEPWNEEGICVLCDEFVSMDLVPEFREDFGFEPLPISRFEPQDARALRIFLEEVLKEEGFEGLSEEVERKLIELDALPNYHCMLRHILESVLRFSNLAPMQEEKARLLGMESPVRLSLLLIRGHLLLLGFATEIDVMAAPLQAEGVPIVCQDVPPISSLP